MLHCSSMLWQKQIRTFCTMVVPLIGVIFLSSPLFSIPSFFSLSSPPLLSFPIISSSQYNFQYLYILKLTRAVLSDRRRLI